MVGIPSCSTRPGDEGKVAGAGRPLVLDTNGNGKRDAYVETEVRPARSAEGQAESANGLYAVGRRRRTGPIWGSSLGFPGAVDTA